MWENCISAAVDRFLIISRSICNNKIEPSIAIDITCTPPLPPNSSITLEPFIVCYDGNTRHESKYTNILLDYEMRASWNSIARETPKGNKNNKEDDVKNATTKNINENFRFQFKSVEIAGGMNSISLFSVRCSMCIELIFWIAIWLVSNATLRSNFVHSKMVTLFNFLIATRWLSIGSYALWLITLHRDLAQILPIIIIHSDREKLDPQLLIYIFFKIIIIDWFEVDKRDDYWKEHSERSLENWIDKCRWSLKSFLK